MNRAFLESREISTGGKMGAAAGQHDGAAFRIGAQFRQYLDQAVAHGLRERVHLVGVVQRQDDDATLAFDPYELGHDHARSNTAASPCPPPMHMVSRA